MPFLDRASSETRYRGFCNWRNISARQYRLTAPPQRPQPDHLDRAAVGGLADQDAGGTGVAH
jgi:hypothetical protein